MLPIVFCWIALSPWMDSKVLFVGSFYFGWFAYRYLLLFQFFHLHLTVTLLSQITHQLSFWSFSAQLLRLHLLVQEESAKPFHLVQFSNVDFSKFPPSFTFVSIPPAFRCYSCGLSLHLWPFGFRTWKTYLALVRFRPLLTLNKMLKLIFVLATAAAQKRSFYGKILET